MAKEVITRDVNAAQRAMQAIELRKQKLSYDEIAARCGYSGRSAARKAIMRELQRVAVRNIEELRTEELAILDAMHAECWQLAMDRKNRGRLFAMDRLLQISKARRELMGLDMGPEDHIAQQNYTKRVILIHEEVGSADLH